MAMEVEIVSQELIKPASPTPHHLRTHLLSFLDQFLPPVYIPVFLFYMNQETSISSADIIAYNSRRAQLLKESLSETLTLFYPFAGRINDHLSVDCNDEGAYYVEARVNRPLGEFLKLTDSPYVPQLHHAKSIWTEPSAGGYAAMIQVTTFACGGIVIGACLSHLIADGTAVTMFLRSWSSMTRKSGDEIVYPNFNACSVFPQNVAFTREAISALMRPLIKIGPCRTMRIVFDASAIASLKARTASSSVPNPTRVEAVSALLSKCIMAAFKAKSDIQKPSLINYTVDFRQRAVPPISKHSMGNFLVVAAAPVTENETELENLACLARKAIRKVDGDFVGALQGDGGCLKYLEHIKEAGEASCGEIDKISFTSLCRFGLYEMDYGWGKPTWVMMAKAPNKSETVTKNTVFLMDTKMGHGIEALVSLEEQHAVVLERDEELLAFGKLGQSPLEMNYSA